MQSPARAGRKTLGPAGRRLWGSCPLVTEGQEAEGMLCAFWQAVGTGSLNPYKDPRSLGAFPHFYGLGD